MRRPLIGTLVLQRDPPPASQVLPWVLETTVWSSREFPVTGLATVTAKVTVTLAPVANGPLQVSVEPFRVTVPVVAVVLEASYVASSSSPARGRSNVAGAYAVCPVF